MFRKMIDSIPYGTIDERTKAIAYQGDAYACRFLMFAILFDAFYRGISSVNTTWDLLIIVMIAGGISLFYQIKHKVILNGSNLKQGLFFILVTAGIGIITALITTLFL